MIKRNCLKCNKSFEIAERAIKRGRGKYCSKKCQYAVMNFKRERNPRWNGGRISNWAGYVLVSSPNHPNKDSHGYVREHRLVMEKKLGRYLLPTEDVDHLNGIKNDNRPENLQVLSRQDHVKIEHKRGIYKNHLLKLNGGYFG